MKYAVILFLALLMGCGQNSSAPHPFETWMQDNGKIKVLSTTAMIDDLVGKIGGRRIDHLTLITGEIDPHSYERVKGDDEKLSRAQVVFYNGLGLEHGASLRYLLQNHPRGVALGDEIRRQDPDRILISQGQIDPHIWMDISLWSLAIDPITAALSAIDPEGKETYEKNAQELQMTMRAAHASLYHSLQQVPEEKRYLVASHDAFQYFTKAYLASASERENGEWKNRFEAPEGLAPDNQLSSSDIQRIIDYLILYHIEVLFPESNVSRDALKKIASACKEKGLNVTVSKESLYGDAMGSPESAAGTYLGMMEWDGDAMIKAWK